MVVYALAGAGAGIDSLRDPTGRNRCAGAWRVPCGRMQVSSLVDRLRSKPRRCLCRRGRLLGSWVSLADGYRMRNFAELA